jgi:hypothetical protein
MDMDKDTDHMDISMDIDEKSVEMDVDVKYHIHGNPAFRTGAPTQIRIWEGYLWRAQQA